MPIDASEIALIARRAFAAHPATWTSYAELSEASGLTRRHARAVAVALIPVPTHDCWFRIRNDQGVYNGAVGAGAYGQNEADPNFNLSM